MSILVTGGAGFIGNHMVLGLLDAGEDVFVLDDLSTGFRWAVSAEANFIHGSVGDCELVENVLRRNQIEAIIHFAGSVGVAESIREPLRYYLNKLATPGHLSSVPLKQQSLQLYRLALLQRRWSRSSRAERPVDR